MKTTIICTPDADSSGLTLLGKNQAKHIGWAFEDDAIPPQAFLVGQNQQVDKLAAMDIIAWMQSRIQGTQDRKISLSHRLNHLKIQGNPISGSDPRFVRSLQFPEAKPTGWDESGGQYIERLRGIVDTIIDIPPLQHVAFVVESIQARALYHVLSFVSLKDALTEEFSPGSITQMTLSRTSKKLIPCEPLVLNGLKHFGM